MGSQRYLQRKLDRHHQTVVGAGDRAGLQDGGAGKEGQERQGPGGTGGHGIGVQRKLDRRLHHLVLAPPDRGRCRGGGGGGPGGQGTGGQGTPPAAQA